MSGEAGMKSGTRSRKEFLIDGRRVRVADLVDAGLLRDGDILRFSTGGEVYSATVDGDGSLRIDGKEPFHTPSRAAAEVSGLPAVAGWNAWSLEDGRTLDEVRQQFLDDAVMSAGKDSLAVHSKPDADVSDELDTSDEQLDETVRRANFLKRARGEATTSPVTVSVRELIDYWGARGRGSVVTQRILSDLDNYGLATAPDFQVVGLDTRVRLILETEATTSVSAAGASGGQQEGNENLQPVVGQSRSLRQQSVEVAAADSGATLGNIPGVLAGTHGAGHMVKVGPGASLDEVVTVMKLNDCRFLPVVKSGGEVLGVVTWERLAEILHFERDVVDDGKLTADYFMVHAATYPYATRLVDVLGDLLEGGCLFVKGPSGRVEGMVTLRDAVNSLGEFMKPFVLLRELETLLRRVMDTYYRDELDLYCNRLDGSEVRSVRDMTMGDYVQVLRNKEAWKKIAWPVSRAIFVDRLDEIRKFRNQMMHFNPDGVPAEDIALLQAAIELLKTVPTD